MTNKKETGYIAAITRGHNAGVCLLKDGEIVFSIEEERISRFKYDGTPLASMVKVLEYTDKLDYLVIAHTTSIYHDGYIRVDYTQEDLYTASARKLGLIEKVDDYPHPQVVDFSQHHHKLHAACAFYRSGFESAAGVIVDGAGTLIPLDLDRYRYKDVGWETETLYDCSYPANFKTIWKHVGTKGPIPMIATSSIDEHSGEEFELIVSETAGITKVYEGVTDYCGFSTIEAGKTMGLFPYGKPRDDLPPMFVETDVGDRSNRHFVVPAYPTGSWINETIADSLNDYHKLPDPTAKKPDFTVLESRRDMAYKVQKETQDQVLQLILKAVEKTGNKNVVLSGGYGLNCVANYYYLQELKKHDINLYVEPISNDAGTAIGAALMFYKNMKQDENVFQRQDTVYLGPEQDIKINDILLTSKKFEAEVTDATHETLVDLITSKNIVAVFQGRSENGPRALGNRSLLFDPTFKDGKDFVNEIKRREYFRPFAGSILEEDAHEWFDLRGMESSPTMMYAVNCQPGIEEKIPAIIHIDGTCRIQTVNREQNPHYYDIIKTFKERTGTPVVFNTSFNLGGEPLVETLDDACRTLAESKIEYLYLPEHGKLITIKND